MSPLPPKHFEVSEGPKIFYGLFQGRPTATEN